LSRALAADAKSEVEFAMRVGTLVALGHSRGEIAAALDATPAEVRGAIERLRRIGHDLS
jgi:DNA-binding CsgD family transcriptional regulator